MNNKENEKSSSPESTAVLKKETSEGTNIDAENLDKETALKLRGDTIGDTLYSQSFVLKTLLQFSDLNWDERLEEDLCFLWDMTLEKDVCTFLLEVSYTSLACNAVLNHKDNKRFIEIVIGILGNLFCSGCENRMTLQEISLIFSTLDTDDHLILIQLMRFINASLVSNTVLTKLIDRPFMEKICFILDNSINSDLLIQTLECVSKLTSDFRINEDLVDCSLYKSTLVSYQTLTTSESNSFEPDTKEKLLSVRYFLEIITNVCSYIDRFQKSSLLKEIQQYSNLFTNEIMKILNFFSKEENLLPITDEIIFFMSAITYTFTNLKLNYVPDIFLYVTKLLYISADIKDEVGEFFESALELECYLISCTNHYNIKKCLKHLSRQKVKTVLNAINENCKRLGFSINISDL